MEIAMITHDCTDPRGLAKFYAALLDAELEHEKGHYQRAHQQGRKPSDDSACHHQEQPHRQGDDGESQAHGVDDQRHHSLVDMAEANPEGRHHQGELTDLGEVETGDETGAPAAASAPQSMRTMPLSGASTRQRRSSWLLATVAAAIVAASLNVSL